MHDAFWITFTCSSGARVRVIQSLNLSLTLTFWEPKQHLHLEGTQIFEIRGARLTVNWDLPENKCHQLITTPMMLRFQNHKSTKNLRMQRTQAPRQQDKRSLEKHRLVWWLMIYAASLSKKKKPWILCKHGENIHLTSRGSFLCRPSKLTRWQRSWPTLLLTVAEIRSSSAGLKEIYGNTLCEMFIMVNQQLQMGRCPKLSLLD